MKYQIGDVVSLMRLTREAIRSYEAMRIIDPIRDKQSGYRKYDLTDIGALIRVRRYRSYGFTLREAATLLNDCTAGQISDRLKQQSQALAEEIRKKQLLHRCMCKWAGLVDALPQLLTGCELVQSPSIFALELSDGEVISRDLAMRNLLRDWVDHEPLVFSGGMHSDSGNPLDFSDGRTFFCAEEADARMLGLDRSPRTEFWKSRLCVRTAYYTAADGSSRQQASERVARMLREKGLQPYDGSFFRTILLAHKGDGPRVYRDVFIPVEP